MRYPDSLLSSVTEGRLNRSEFYTAFFLVKRQNSGRESARPRFCLRAVESVEKCSWECFREGTKSCPVVVPL